MSTRRHELNLRIGEFLQALLNASGGKNEYFTIVVSLVRSFVFAVHDEDIEVEIKILEAAKDRVEQDASLPGLEPREFNNAVLGLCVRAAQSVAGTKGWNW